MPGKSIDELTDRLSASLNIAPTMSNNKFSTAQKEEIRAIVSDILKFDASSDSLDEDCDHPISIVKVEELDKIPDIVKTIRDFSGKAGEFGSWRKSVERVLDLFKELKGTSKYYAILHTIRTKITGEADTALDSYRTPLDWNKIKKCLMMHYSDKRDIGTLEYQLSTMSQGQKTITDYYQAVYQHLSLILDKIACLDLNESSLMAMTNAYRDKALDTFIRGLRGDLPRLLSVREPSSLPQALHICLKLDNMSYRMNQAQGYNQRMDFLRKGPGGNFYPQLAHIGGATRPPLPTRYQPRPNYYYGQPQPNRPLQNHYMNNPQQMYNHPGPAWNTQAGQSSLPKPEPMDIDRSLQTRQVNYINRPQFNPAIKRPLGSYQGPSPKVQRNFHLNTGNYPDQIIETGENTNSPGYEQQADTGNSSDLINYSNTMAEENVEDLLEQGDNDNRVSDNIFPDESYNADLNFFV